MQQTPPRGHSQANSPKQLLCCDFLRKFVDGSMPPLHNDETPVTPSQHLETRMDPASTPRRGLNVTLILSVIAVILSGFAVYASLYLDQSQPGFSFRTPGAGPLGKYDMD